MENKLALLKVLLVTRKEILISYKETTLPFKNKNTKQEVDKKNKTHLKHFYLSNSVSLIVQRNVSINARCPL